MINKSRIVWLSIIFLSACTPAKHITAVKSPVLTTGVSRQLAAYRKAVISHINYKLELSIPAEKAQIITAYESLTFLLKSTDAPLQIDFKEDSSKLKQISVNGRSVAIQHTQEHIIISPEYLKQGNNEVRIWFQAGEAALNRNADYLYTLFVPDRARTVFPCFDQPDLKATYTLSLELPVSWKAMTNGPLNDSTLRGARKNYRFATSDTLSTYLFAFAAGNFELANGSVAGKATDFLYRETDTAKIDFSMKDIFGIHSDAINYLENWTGIPYPFQKFGFVAIPDFQFGGMEHAGAIQYKASSLFLDGGSTRDQQNGRTNLITHETAHMWFGDLVTMDWFTDVWMKEVFANFMADKSTEKAEGKESFDLKFLIDHFTAAYGIDRTTGANPIRQDLDNLKDAGTLYGNIIYHKAPIMMRQLERLMGKDKFQQGVREYLHRFANTNASWPDLITILDRYSDADLQSWNKVWVNEPGRPVIDYTTEVRDNKITRFTITQTPEYGRSRIWPQLFEVTLFYPDRTKELTVNMDKATVVLQEAIGLEKPLFVLFNSSGQGYGLWPVDPAMNNGLYAIKQPLSRSAAYISLYENMLNARAIKPVELLNLFIAGLSVEKDELSLKLLTNYISSVFWEFTLPAERQQLATALENALWTALQQQSLPNNKKQLFKAYQEVFLSPGARNNLYAIWKDQKAPDGLKLTEDDYTSLAFSLALRNEGAEDILNQQLVRITNTDRKKRFEFIMPAVSPDEMKRDAFFNSLKLKANRTKESIVVTALGYLHHPLRQPASTKYLAKSLQMLEEIQTTGDIFFPQSWLQSTFGYYQSREAAQIVRDFLATHPDYNPKLKAKILQTADNLFRAEKILSL